MAASSRTVPSHSTGRSWRPGGGRFFDPHALRLVIVLLWVPIVVGCRGCGKPPLSEEEREARRQELREKESKKPEFEFIRFSVRPNQSDKIEVGVKPGHWTTGAMEARANHNDYRGELAGELVQQGRPVDLDQVPFRLRISGPAIMPKGQKRLFEYPLYAPLETSSHSLATRLLTGPGGREIMRDLTPLERMPAHQYYFLVLADNPDAYRFLKSLDSIRAPRSDLGDDLRDSHYRVVMPQLRNRLPLPNGALSWTAIAYVLWDDLDPKLFTPDKQQALLDWLHWGGQLVISGPRSLDNLRGSFLEPYLPADGGDSWQLKQQQLSQLSTAWTLDDRPLKIVRHWTGQKLKPRPQATVLAASGQDPLVTARRVGRGRIVLTAFRLSQRELRNWPNFDGFFNGCILGRESRTFELHNLAVKVRWAQDTNPYNPGNVSRLRYFTRDHVANNKAIYELRRPRPDAPSVTGDFSQLAGRMMSEGATPYMDEQGPPIGPGVAAWDDFSAASDVASAALTDAAGIVVPGASFVIWVLVVYISVLVPLNWAFFRLIGRVELAWAAAPFIAIACSVAVVYLAQLDIGFARSRTELDVVEIQGNYHRAHLTRYIALYSSLSTQYRLDFEDDTALALPFPTGQRLLAGQDRETVDFRRARQQAPGALDDRISQVTLDGLRFISNSTGMVHAEQIYDLGGGIRCEPLAVDHYRVTNHTNLALQGVGIVSGDSMAWIGSLAPAAEVKVHLVQPPSEKFWKPKLKHSLKDIRGDESQPAQVLTVENMMALAYGGVPRGELRLVAWTADALGGLVIEPAASQNRHMSVVVAHLDYGPLPRPQHDSNARSAVQAELESRAPLETPPDETTFDSIEGPGVGASPGGAGPPTDAGP